MITNKDLVNQFKNEHLDENGIILDIGVEFFRQAFEYMKKLPEDEPVDEISLKKDLSEFGGKCDIDEVLWALDVLKNKEKTVMLFENAKEISYTFKNHRETIEFRFFNESNKLITKYEVFKLNCIPWQKSKWTADAGLCYANGYFDGFIKKYKDKFKIGEYDRLRQTFNEYYVKTKQ